MRTLARRLLGAVLALGAAVAVLWVPLWLWGPVGPPAAPAAYAALSLTPVAVVGALLVGAVALGTRRWVVGGVATVAALVLAAIVAPRALPDGAEGIAGPGPAPLTVATVNLQFGRGDAGEVVALVRAQRVAVLGLQEITPEAEARLAAAGLFTELPFRLSAAGPGAEGTALASRYPLSPSGLALGPSVLAQVTARVAAPGGALDVVVTHPAAPLFRDDPQGWAREIARLPGPVAPTGVPLVVMGDFNATLDHGPLRALLDRGQRDAAATLGDGLVATWPTDRALLPPFAAIDHVLLSGPVAPAGLDTVTIPGSDHAAVVVTLGPAPAAPAPAAAPR